MTALHFSRVAQGVLGLGFALLLSSCYDTKEEFTLNPDGSGKVRHECSFQEINLNSGNNTPEEALQGAVSRVIHDSKGVEVWRDVSFKKLSDGRIWFQGTAYFKNLAELEITNQSLLSFTWKNQGGGKAEMELQIKKSDTAKPAAKSAGLTSMERAEKLKADRAKFKQAKPMLSAMLGRLHQSVTFQLPGKITSNPNFTKKSPNTVGLVFEGSKMLDALEKLTNDDAWLTKNGFDDQKSPVLDNEMSGLLFGEKSPVRVTLSDITTPLFNYAAEVAAAKKDLPKLEKQLGGVEVAPPAKGGELKSLKVVGMRMISEVDKKLGVRPFNWDAGYTISLLGELPGSVLNISDKSAVTKAITNEGVSLIRGDGDWERRLGFPELSTDKASVLFNLDLKVPPPGTTGLKELSGTLQYRVAGGAKEVDLGLKTLTAGTKSDTLGASIEKVKESWQKNGSQDMEIKLKLKPDDLKTVSLVVDGVKTELTRGGYSNSGDITTFTFNSKTAFPENGDIVVEVFDSIQSFDVPFKLENLTLLGTPAGK